MKKCWRKLVRASLRLEIIIGVCGVILSVAMHELYHIVVHFGEIDAIHIFPDTQAIVEVLFTPTQHYNLAAEEAVAYTITMLTLILTAMLISDVHDARQTNIAHCAVLDADFMTSYSNDEAIAIRHLLHILQNEQGVPGT